MTSAVKPRAILTLAVCSLQRKRRINIIAGTWTCSNGLTQAPPDNQINLPLPFGIGTPRGHCVSLKQKARLFRLGSWNNIAMPSWEPRLSHTHIHNDRLINDKLCFYNRQNVLIFNAHPLAYIHTHTHTHTHRHHTHIHTHTHTHTHTQLLSARARTDTHAHTYIHTYTHTYNHTRIHTYMCTTYRHFRTNTKHTTQWTEMCTDTFAITSHSRTST